MKKLNILQMLPQALLLSALLVGCNPVTPAETAFFVPQIVTKNINSGNFYQNIDRPLMESFIAGKRSFVFFVGNIHCSACNFLKPMVKEYVQDTKAEIYYIDTSSDEYRANVDYYIETFNISATPTLILFNGGIEVARMRGVSELQNQKQVNTFFQTYVKTTNYYVLNEDSEKTTKKHVTFTYDFYDENAQNVLNSYFLPHVDMKNAYTYLKHEVDALPVFMYSTSTEVIPFATTEGDLNEQVSNFQSFFA